jgi:hypothetical protein
MQPGMMQPGMMPGGGMMHRGGGGMHEGGPMGGSMGGGMRGMGHLEHMMVHHPKEAARIMRFRADMLRAMSDVLAKHAAELDKAQ